MDKTLEALVEKWRAEASRCGDQHRKQTGYEVSFCDAGKEYAFDTCADELAAALAAREEAKTEDGESYCNVLREIRLHLGMMPQDWADALDYAIVTSGKNIGVGVDVADGVAHVVVMSGNQVIYSKSHIATPARPAAEGMVEREAWAILRPDGKTIHPESVRGCEHAAQWSIGEWNEMKAKGFQCIPVLIRAARPSGGGEVGE